MKKGILILLVLIFIPSSNILSQNVKDSLVPYEKTTIIELVINSSKYNLKKVVIAGVFHKEGYVFFSKEDFEYSIFKNSFKVKIGNIKKESLESLDGKYVKIYGVFQISNDTGISGSITEVHEITNLDNKLFEKHIDEYLMKNKDHDDNIFITK